MPDNIVGAIPKFTPNDGEQIEEEKQPIEANPAEIEEKDTPPELPAEEQPDDLKPETVEEPLKIPEVEENRSGISKAEAELLVVRATQGLRDEVVGLRHKLKEATGVAQKRDIEKQIDTIKDEVDELQDLNPDEVAAVDRILRAKGYMTKDESAKMAYKSAKDDAINSFIEEFPEYKPKNDVDDLKWNALQQEVSLYKTPENPKDIVKILKRAHLAISKPSGDPKLPVKKQAVKTASVGTGGAQRSTSNKHTLTPEQIQHYRDGGWSEEEISNMQK